MISSRSLTHAANRLCQAQPTIVLYTGPRSFSILEKLSCLDVLSTRNVFIFLITMIISGVQRVNGFHLS